MNPKLRKAIERELLSIYATWHRCGLRKAERGLKKGRLCDVCLEVIENHLKTIGEASGS